MALGIAILLHGGLYTMRGTRHLGEFKSQKFGGKGGLSVCWWIVESFFGGKIGLTDTLIGLNQRHALTAAYVKLLALSVVGGE